MNTIRFLPGGEVRKIHEDDDVAVFGCVVPSRASHVEPANHFLRLLFHLLRWLFGERGRVGEWTRRWRCLWRARIILKHGTVLGLFATRDAAVAAELEYLLKNWILEPCEPLKESPSSGSEASPGATATSLT